MFVSQYSVMLSRISSRVSSPVALVVRLSAATTAVALEAPARARGSHWSMHWSRVLATDPTTTGGLRGDQRPCGVAEIALQLRSGGPALMQQPA